MKYLKVSSIEKFNSVNQTVSQSLGLPNNKALTALQAEEVFNQDHADFGSFISVIPTEGPWKCDHLIDSSLLFDFDEKWFPAVF